MMKKLLVLMLLASVAYGQSWDSTKTSDNPRAGMYKFNSGIKEYILGKKADTTGWSGFRYPVMVLQGDSLWVAKEGVVVGGDSGKIVFKADDDSLSSLGSTSVGPINTTLLPPVFNVVAFGADKTGLTDSRAAIQRAIDSAASVGGTAYMPNGWYRIDSTLYTRSNLKFLGEDMNGVFLVRGDTTTFSAMLATLNADYGTGAGDSDIVISGFTLDGNNDLQGYTVADSNAQYGVQIYLSTRIYVDHIRVMNVWGTLGGEPGESFAMTFNSCSNINVSNCVFVGDSNSSTGLSFNGTVNSTVTNSMSYNFTRGAGGYTQWSCRNIRYVGCSAWGNENYAGFNNENSDNTFYVNCYAGGRIPYVDLAVGLWEGSYPYPATDTLKNTHGFVIGANATWTAHSTSNHTLIGCTAENNLINGINATGITGLTIIGGSFSNNDGYGIYQYGTTAVDSAFQLLMFGPKVTGNMTHQIGLWYDAFIDDYAFGTPMFVSYGRPSTASDRKALIADVAGMVSLQTIDQSVTYPISHGNGWYRMISTKYGIVSGEYYINSSKTTDTVQTHWRAYLMKNPYTDDGSINVVERLQYGAGGYVDHIDSVRLGNIGDTIAVMDIKFVNVEDTTRTFIVSVRGNITLPDTADFDPTPPDTITAIMRPYEIGYRAFGSNKAFTHRYSIESPIITLDADSVINLTTPLAMLNSDTVATREWVTSLGYGTGPYLVPTDSTLIRNYSSAIYLKNADSTTLKNALLKNADSTAIRNYSNSIYLKNADSTTIKNGIAATYAPKASPTFTGLATFEDVIVLGTDPDFTIKQSNASGSPGVYFLDSTETKYGHLYLDVDSEWHRFEVSSGGAHHFFVAATDVFYLTETRARSNVEHLFVGPILALDNYKVLNKAGDNYVAVMTRNTAGTEVVQDLDYIGKLTTRTNTGSTVLDSMKVVGTDTLAFWVGGVRFVAIKNP